MATYKFVDADQLDSDLTQVGDAIRAKGGTTQSLVFPDEMVSAIAAISTGVELNFDVVAYATEAALLAATPKENTIGIITTVDISSWVFSATEPEKMAEGEVWFPTGTSRAVEFNALKKNSLQVYPLYARQYVGGAWVSKPAKIYQAENWVNLWDGVLYDAGDQCEEITGGWERNSSMNFDGSANTGAVTFEADYINLNSPVSTAAIISTKNKVTIDTGCFSVLNFDISIFGYSGNDSYGIIDHHGNVFADSVASAYSKASVGSRITLQVPVSTVPAGDYYVHAAVSNERQRYVHKIWME